MSAPSFPEGSFTHVIHAATEASATLNLSDPLLMLDTIVDGTRRSLDFAISSGARRFLLASSGAVYGTQPPTLSHMPGRLYAAVPTRPIRVGYMVKANAWRNSCARCIPPIRAGVKIARCFAFAGPYLPLDAHFAISNFIAIVWRAAHRGSWRWHAFPLLSVCGRPGDLALDDSGQG